MLTGRCRSTIALPSSFQRSHRVKDKCPPEEINERIRNIAFNAMAKSVVYVDIDPADRAFGGFNPADRAFGGFTLYLY